MRVYNKAQPTDRLTRFYEYSQNNSGGSFDYDEDDGISHYVIVEATSGAEADRLAQRIGLYFDGSSDCSCCGNRWSEQWGDHSQYEKGELHAHIADIMTSRWSHKWMEEGQAEIFVHYLDGTVIGFWIGAHEDDVFLENYLEGKTV